MLLLLTFGIQKISDSILFIKSGQPWSVMPLVLLVKTVGFPFSQVLTVFAILSESIFPFMVAIGLWTRSFSILIVLSMTGALYTSLIIHDPVISWGSAIQYILIFTSITIAGPGKLSLDRLIQMKRLRLKFF